MIKPYVEEKLRSKFSTTNFHHVCVLCKVLEKWNWNLEISMKWGRFFFFSFLLLVEDDDEVLRAKRKNGCFYGFYEADKVSRFESTLRRERACIRDFSRDSRFIVCSARAGLQDRIYQAVPFFFCWTLKRFSLFFVYFYTDWAVLANVDFDCDGVVLDKLLMSSRIRYWIASSIRLLYSRLDFNGIHCQKHSVFIFFFYFFKSTNTIDSFTQLIDI